MTWVDYVVMVGLLVIYLSVANTYRRLDKIETRLQNIWNKINGLD